MFPSGTLQSGQIGFRVSGGKVTEELAFDSGSWKRSPFPRPPNQLIHSAENIPHGNPYWPTQE